MTRESASLVAYARAVEQLWSKRAERAVVLSPKEWKLVCHWFERGILLDVIERELDASVGRRRAAGGPRSLTYHAAAVEQAWRVVVEGRLPVEESRSVSGEGSDPLPEIEPWRRRRDAEPAGSHLRALMDDLLERRRSGESRQELDRRLDRALPDAVDEALATRETEAVDLRLAPHRGTMPPAEFEKTRRRATVDRLRRALGLPRLEDRPGNPG